MAPLLALSILQGCATGMDVKVGLKNQKDPAQTYTESFEVARKVGTVEKVYNMVTPWNMIIDHVYYTDLWKEADKVICEKGGLRKAAEEALMNMYPGLVHTNQQLVNQINQAACEDYSRRGLSNALSKLTSTQLVPLTKNLESILEKDKDFKGRAYFGDYIVDVVNVEGNDKKLAPELRFVIRRVVDGAIIAGIVVGATAGGGAAAVAPFVGGGQ